MKNSATFAVLTLFLQHAIAEEYVNKEISGEGGQHVALTCFFFDGDDCYGARRQYWNSRTHVIRPKTHWDLYFGGELVATVDSGAFSMDYVKVPAGMEFKKTLSKFSLTKNGKLVRVWNLGEKLTIFPPGELDRLSREESPDNPDFKKLLKNYSPQFRAPTKKEAEEKMKKVSSP